MTGKYKKVFTSDNAKKIYLTVAVTIILFFLFNDFLMPWYVDEGGILTVPSIIGLKFDDAKKFLDSLGLETRKGDVRMDREHPAGIVVIQNPIEGAKVKRGRRVYLTVSGGEVMVEIPNIRGRTLRDARFILEREGLKLGALEYQPSDEFPENTVIEQKIPAGAKVKKDVYVSIILSQGSLAQKVSMPDVTGKALAEALKILAKIGLKLGNVSYVPSSDLLPNTVLDQYPRIGEMVEINKTVDLIIVLGGEKKKDFFEN